MKDGGQNGKCKEMMMVAMVVNMAMAMAMVDDGEGRQH